MRASAWRMACGAVAARRFELVMGAAVVAPALAGCGTPTAESAEAPFATYGPARDEGMVAILRGTLELNDGCLVIATEQDEHYVPVFSDTAQWLDGTLVHRDQRYHEGDEVSFGGGESGQVADARYGFPEGCPEEANVWIAN